MTVFHSLFCNQDCDVTHSERRRVLLMSMVDDAMLSTGRRSRASRTHGKARAWST
jgi:hypothetical protein